MLQVHILCVEARKFSILRPETEKTTRIKAIIIGPKKQIVVCILAKIFYSLGYNSLYI